MFKSTFLTLAVLLCLATSAGATVAAAQADGPFQVRYATNLQIADGVVRITNTGVFGSPICANVYGLAGTTGQLKSCCSCLIAPNALRTLSVYQDLLADGPVPSPVPNTMVIKLISIIPTLPTNTCSATSAAPLANGMAAWGISQQPGFFSPTPIITETPFTVSTLSVAEIASLTSQCAVLHPGPHACPSCP